jgi:hypothetical protein
MDIIDSIELGTIEGFDIRADIVQDDTALDTPLDVAEYQPDTVEAWLNEEWMFVGIIVTASRAGTDLGSDSIWMVERGDIPGIGDVDPLRDKDGSLDCYRADMIDNAIADARLKLTELIDAAIDGSMGDQ